MQAAQISGSFAPSSAVQQGQRPATGLLNRRTVNLCGSGKPQNLVARFCRFGSVPRITRPSSSTFSRSPENKPCKLPPSDGASCKLARAVTTGSSNPKAVQRLPRDPVCVGKRISTTEVSAYAPTFLGSSSNSKAACSTASSVSCGLSATLRTPYRGGKQNPATNQSAKLLTSETGALGALTSFQRPHKSLLLQPRTRIHKKLRKHEVLICRASISQEGKGNSRPGKERDKAPLPSRSSRLRRRAQQLLRTAVWAVGGVGVLVLAGYAQHRTKVYVNKKVLPPVAAVASSALGREVSLGDVKALWPLGVKLGPVYVGPEEHEFSCGHVESIEVSVNPLASIMKGHVVLEASADRPQILVSQLADWTWLTIPKDVEGSSMKTSDDPGLAERTRILRRSREAGQIAGARERDALARLGAELSYAGHDVLSEPQRRTADAPATDASSRKEALQERHQEGLPGRHSQGSRSAQALGHPAETGKRSLFSRWFSDVWLLKGLGNAVGQAIRDGLFGRTSQSREAKEEDVQRHLLQQSAKAVLSRVKMAEKASGSSVPTAEGQPPAEDPGVKSAKSYFSDRPRTAVSHICRKLTPFLSPSSLRSLFGGMSNEDASMLNGPAAPPDSTFNSQTHAAGTMSPDGTPVTASEGGGNERVADGAGSEEQNPSVSLDTVKFSNGTLLLLAYGDLEPRVAEGINGKVELSNSYSCIQVQADGWVRQWRKKGAGRGSGGRLFLEVDVDDRKKEWEVMLKGSNLFAPVLERLFEMPLDWYNGRAEGELLLYMGPQDNFPNFRGRLDVKDLEFQIWDAPSSFTAVTGALLFERQRMFLHDATGFYGDVPLTVSGDMDLNIINGEYRLAAKAKPVEINMLLRTLNAKPPPYPLAGAVEGTITCRGPLDAPIFEGTVETSPMGPTLAGVHSPPTMPPPGVAFPAGAGVVGDAGRSMAESVRSQFLSLSSSGGGSGGSTQGGGAGADDGTQASAQGQGQGQAAGDRKFDAINALRNYHHQGGIAAFDKLPLAAASGSFSFSTDDCVVDLHGARVAPVGGGEVRAAGTLWVCPEGEMDPSSVVVDCWGLGLSLDTLAEFYLPPGAEAPIPGLLGLAEGSGKVRGALLAPTIDVKWQAKDARGPLDGLHGEVNITRQFMAASASGMSFESSAHVSTSFPPLPLQTPKLRRPPAHGKLPPPPALQAPAPRPIIDGADVDIRLKSFDLLGLVPAGTETVAAPPSGSSHLKLNGKVKVSGKSPLAVAHAAHVAEATQAAQAAHAAHAAATVQQPPQTQEGEERAAGGGERGEGLDEKGKDLLGSRKDEMDYFTRYEGEVLPGGFVGEVSMQGLRLNQLLLAQNVSGPVEASPSGVEMSVVGRADEQLLLRLTLPEKGIPPALEGGSFQPIPPQASPTPAVTLKAHGGAAAKVLGLNLGKAVEQVARKNISSAAEQATRKTSSSASGGGAPLGAVSKGAADAKESAAPAAATLLLKRGKMKFNGAFESGSVANMELQNLQLDELELASLRGLVERVAVNLNFAKRRGAGKMSVQQPRFSGLQSEFLDASFRWQGDVVTLERSVLEQCDSRYELQGEYVLPGTREQRARGDSEAESDGLLEQALPEQLRGLITSIGRWRLRLDVPRAEIAEMLPAARILSGSHDPAVLFRSKELFLSGVESAGFMADSLQEQLQYIRKKKGEFRESTPGQESQGGVLEDLPGWADLRGQWSGWIEARGGGKGELAAAFDLKGRDWEAGAHKLQQVHAAGEYNRKDGLCIDRIFVQKDDAATLHADGTLLAPSSNLHFAVLNFPASLVPTFMQAMHATSPSQHSLAGAQILSPAASAPDPMAPVTASEVAGYKPNFAQGMAQGPFGGGGSAAPGVSNGASGSHGGAPPPPPQLDPTALRGTIFMEGDLRGSISEPQCELQVRLLDGAVGGVPLGRAELAATINPESRLFFHAVMEPAADSGHVRVKGSVPLKLLPAEGAPAETPHGDSTAETGASSASPQAPAWKGEGDQREGEVESEEEVAASRSGVLRPGSDGSEGEEGRRWKKERWQAQLLGRSSSLPTEAEREKVRDREAASEGSWVSERMWERGRDREHRDRGDDNREGPSSSSRVGDWLRASRDGDSPSKLGLSDRDKATQKEASLRSSPESDPRFFSIEGLSPQSLPGEAFIHAEAKAEEEEDVPQRGVELLASVKAMEHPQGMLGPDAVEVDGTIKDGGMRLLTALTPGFRWIQGFADVVARVRGTVTKPSFTGQANFAKVTASSPVLPRPLTNFAGTVTVENNSVVVDELEGKVGRRGAIRVKGELPLFPVPEGAPPKAAEDGDKEEAVGKLSQEKGKRSKNSPSVTASGSSTSSPPPFIDISADSLEVRARSVFSGIVDSHVKLMGSVLAPEVTGSIKLSQGIAFLSQEKPPPAPASPVKPSTVMGNSVDPMTPSTRATSASPANGIPGAPNTLSGAVPPVLGFTPNGMSMGPLTYPWPASGLPNLPAVPPGLSESNGASGPDSADAAQPSQSAVLLRGLKVQLGPELRLVYPLILNFGTSGELELNGVADPLGVKPKGTLTFENGDVNLVATQMRLNRDYPNKAKFEPELGMNPLLDLKLVGSDWQMKIHGPANRWQDSIILTKVLRGSGEEEVLSPAEAARLFETQLAESLLEEDGQLALKKLAAATVETLMPKIESKGQFGQAKWRLVSAPQIPNLLSLDPTTDPFQSLANLSFGTEVEIQIGNNLQASVVRQLRESEMATQWTLLYQLNSNLRLLFSSLSSVEKRLIFEYSASAQN